MTVLNLQQIGAGFSQEDLGSQAAFRCALDALAMPARWTAMAHDAEVPAGAGPTAAGLLLALLDTDCTLWLSPTLRASQAAAWLRFHTGCRLVEAPGDAMFVWVGQGDACPPLASLDWGSDPTPQDACTLLLDVPALDAAAPSLSAAASGPGIEKPRAVTLPGLPADFLPQWREVHAAFPRGIDLYLCAPEAILALSRSTALTSRED
jgi:alpha-D-ribose 1-methylphosphonate 5-triphosphate synthase subunit PhnH